MLYYIPLCEEVTDTTLGKVYAKSGEYFWDDDGDRRRHTVRWNLPAIVLELE